MEEIPLDAPELPEWLVRFQSLSDLVAEGADLAHRARSAAKAFHGQWSQPFDTANVAEWAGRARAAVLPTEEAAQFAVAMSLIEAAEQTLSHEATREAAGQLIRGVDDGATAIQAAAGKLLRARGQHAMALAIVGQLYRASRSSSFHLQHGSEFGIDDDQLARFVTNLLDEGILEEAGGPDIVRLTDDGRGWLEREIKGGAQKTTDPDEALVWSDARSDVIEASTHLGFMASPELREIVLSVLQEIDTTVRAGATLATMVLCGSVVETMLLDIAEQIPNKLGFASKPNWADAVSLQRILDELRVVGLVGDTTRGLTVANHRDLVHPNRRRKSDIRVDPKAARAMALLVAVVAHDLDDAASNGTLAALRSP
jgi:hypothetical protein